MRPDALRRRVGELLARAERAEHDARLKDEFLNTDPENEEDSVIDFHAPS